VTVDRALCAEAMKVCACFNLRRASRAVTRLFDEILGAAGLRSTQFVALVAIQRDGSSTLPRLARMLGVDRSTLTRSLAPLSKAGYVTTRSAGPSRVASVRVTPAGEAVLARCVPLWKDAQGRFEAKVGAANWKRLLAGLAEVSESAESA
jgi:DNA-binding MarR family transcriptional regulator